MFLQEIPLGKIFILNQHISVQPGNTDVEVSTKDHFYWSSAVMPAKAYNSLELCKHTLNQFGEITPDIIQFVLCLEGMSSDITKESEAAGV